MVSMRFQGTGMLVALLVVLNGAGCTFTYDRTWPGADAASSGSDAHPDRGAPDVSGRDLLPDRLIDIAPPIDQPIPPDRTIPLDRYSAMPGKPCPCAAGLLCFSGICRAYCPAPTDPCKVTSKCPNDHACIKSTKGSYHCMPAVKPGALCSSTKYCPNRYLCTSTGSEPLMCKPICSKKDAPCGVGGKGKCSTFIPSPTCLVCNKP